MQLPKAKLSGFDNQLLKMSCQTVDYNFPQTVLGDLLDLELKQKWAPKHSLFQFQTANLTQKTAPSTVYFADRA